MRARRLVLALTATALMLVVTPAGAATITNGTVTLGVNPQGDLNAPGTGGTIGVTYNATGNDGTRAGCECEGWGAGAAGPVQFAGIANEAEGNSGYTQVSFTSNASSAVSVVDINSGSAAAVPTLRLRQDFHPSPTTPNLYEITTTLENISATTLTNVRYERIMDWDVEPSAFDEFVTINRGATPPAQLFYSDDNGFSDNNPFTFDADGDGPDDPATVNTNYSHKGPADHGARFTFAFGSLAPGESKQFFVYYGAAGNEPAANEAVSAAALEVFSYGQPSVPDGSDADTLPDFSPNGAPNTFIWGFRAVGGRPVIPPSLALTPSAATANVGTGTSITGTLRDSGGKPVPGAKLVFSVAGPNGRTLAGTTDGNGQVNVGYVGANAGTDSITGCLDSNSNNACDAGEVAAGATRTWQAAQQVAGETRQSPVPVLGETVVVGKVGSGVVLVRKKNGKFRRLGANEAIPLGSEIDATKGRVRLTSAAGPGGKTQTADFYKGAFIVTQTKELRPITQLKLSTKLRCPTNKGKKAQTSAKGKKVRRLWGDGKGRFRTRGRRAAATVRGTKWLTTDRCDSTKVTVKRGTVIVRDFLKRKNKIVKKGQSYVARVKPKKK